MNAFELRDRIVGNYREYVRSFIEIRDLKIRKMVDEALDGGALWPAPLVQLNPSFELAETVDELIRDGVLHPECSRIFRRRQAPGDEGSSLRLYRHQVEAIRAARSGGNYVLTTGTGSGKSLAYIIPAVDHVLRRGSGRGIQAVIVYPMNALANSQMGELDKFLHDTYVTGKAPGTYARYTGQESLAEREQLKKQPPDLLLTNYVMLELLLTRPFDRPLVEAAQGLRFLVLDELHTYRGRQGADVAMLVRRARDAFAAPKMQCVGTSATLMGAGTPVERRGEVARVASLLFGGEVDPGNIISESLTRVTPERDLADPEFVAGLRRRLELGEAGLPRDYTALTQDPLSVWLETSFGVRTDPGSGRLVRAMPRSIAGPEGAAAALSRATGVPEDVCGRVIVTQLQASYRCRPDPQSDEPAFAFRLHQFISRGDTVYASPEPEDKRHATLTGQKYVPGSRRRVLLPLVFCRECGQEYYSVRVSPGQGGRVFTPRRLSDTARDENSQAGFLYISSENPWPAETAAVLERVPEDWVEEYQGQPRLRKDYRGLVPERLSVSPDGRESGEGVPAWFIPTPFRFCLGCDTVYDARHNDFAKLTPLATEGRSSATTILSLAAVQYLRGAEELEARARKLLSFTDNRQDASLQAGHFNDFVEVGLLRSALFRAVRGAGPEGLTHDVIVERVFDALNLPLDLYAADPDVRFLALEETKRALRAVLAYRLYRDLKHGWRVTLPNLEQCGLLEIRYLSLPEVCAAEDIWKNLHPVLAEASPETRRVVARTLLDIMRRALAIKVDWLTRSKQEQVEQLSSQRLRQPWALDESEELELASTLFPRSERASDFGGNHYLSARSGFGRYLSRASTFPDRKGKLALADKGLIILDLLKALKVAGLVEEVAASAGEADVPGYQLLASGLLWVAGDGTRAFHDPVRVPRAPTAGGRTNPFFVRHYQKEAREVVGLEAREHTAQVSSDDRRDRERRFHEGSLPILFCSPTMELGVDISQLNVVNLRNVPPTPANYAQRSGRAGRGGQPALVYSYCSTASSHDQYFFRRPERMVAGQVAPPRLDLANEDLIRSHAHAIWLAETGVGLGHSLKEVLDVSGEEPTLELLPSVAATIRSRGPRERARGRAERVLQTISGELAGADWYSPNWLAGVLTRVELEFDRTCDRWRSLYRAAAGQRKLQHRIAGDASRPAEDRKRARRLRAEAEAQIDLLTQAQNAFEADFYSYRYFASEGLLPGYSFPRLPLSAYIPGRRDRRGRNEFVSRPRFLAISEFGPRAIVYHEGARYIISRVILPARGEGAEDLITGSVKQCEDCGYLHPVTEGGGPDVCERCSAQLGPPLTELFRLQNVTTRRRSRISSDEEERLRLGYEIRTGVRFTEHGDRPSFRTATVNLDSEKLFDLTYGGAARIWRLNMGWARRANRSQHGFVLDTERGTWARGDHEIAGDQEGVGGREAAANAEDPMSARTQRVIPFVEDHRNCLLVEPAGALGEAAMAGLQAALKNAIQLEYQLEDTELAAEPLPSREHRRLILLYEAAEGGAGVLRHLLDDPVALSRVAGRALELCHFDPASGEDRHRADRASEDCEAACYDCLMSYTNQNDHALLDRQAIRDVLVELSRARVEASPVVEPRSAHFDKLVRQCDSELERRWLKHVFDKDLRLPSRAQPFLPACETRPDFLYDEELVAVYVDGPPHEYPERQERDRQQTSCLENLGYTVIRFAADEDWDTVIARYPSVFGRSA
jgi:ATP-dependent helicase YprA (DUF1998 family)/very-short-patch-repair endonuclease